MTDAFELAEILRVYTEEQRRDALNQQRWRKITIARVIGETQIQAETVVDQNASADEIFAVLSPLDAAIDRLKAKSDLSDHYFRMLNKCGEIEMSVKKHATERYAYEAANKRHNANKRGEVGLSAQQLQNLRQIRESIHEGFERIEDMRKAASECQRVLGGENPFAVLEEQISKRLDGLRGERQDAA